MYNVVPGSSTGTTCMYSYACICMHTRTYVCVHVIIFISSTHLQGPLYIGYVIATSLIYQIKRHLYIFSLCLKFLNHTKESVPTLFNHISALIIDESHKMLCRTVSHHHLDMCCDWHNIILFSLNRLTVHTHLIICIAQLYPCDAHVWWWFHYYFFSVHMYPQKDTVKIASYSNGGIEHLVKGISVCLYIKM